MLSRVTEADHDHAPTQVRWPAPGPRLRTSSERGRLGDLQVLRQAFLPDPPRVEKDHSPESLVVERALDAGQNAAEEPLAEGDLPEPFLLRSGVTVGNGW